MNNYEHVLEAFTSLIQEGRQLMTTYGWDGKNFQRLPSDDSYSKIRTRSSNLVRRVCGDDSDHYRELEGVAEESLDNTFRLPSVIGILEAAKADFEAGLLFQIRSLVQAEILGGFLDQAEALLAAGYHQAAASLSGAVIEDMLRKMCETRTIELPKKITIEVLNVELAEAGACDRLVQKQITAFADVRNSADHGHFDRVKPADVDERVRIHSAPPPSLRFEAFSEKCAKLRAFGGDGRGWDIKRASEQPVGADR